MSCLSLIEIECRRFLPGFDEVDAEGETEAEADAKDDVSPTWPMNGSKSSLSNSLPRAEESPPHKKTFDNSSEHIDWSVVNGEPRRDDADELVFDDDDTDDSSLSQPSRI